MTVEWCATYLRGAPPLGGRDVVRARDDVALEGGGAEDLDAATGHEVAGVEAGWAIAVR